MPKIRPLAPGQAKRTLAARFAPLADRMRQLNTNMGVRPYRVWLVWTKFGGDERGAGTERVVRRKEILPTPKVVELDVTFASYAAGTAGDGDLKLEEVSAQFRYDELRGTPCPTGDEETVEQPYDFYYEVQLDDRQEGPGHPNQRNRYRLKGQPWLRPGMVMWSLILENASADAQRDGTPTPPA